MLWIAAAAVPALLILYFLKLRRREEVVPSTLLWKRAVLDLQVNAPFQRLRKNLLLLLQLMILAAAIFALARPVVESTLSQEKSVIILIDRSASMNTLEDDKTRLELAKEQAVRLVRSLNQSGSKWFRFAGIGEKTRAMVIAFSDRATVVSPFTTNTSDLIDLIERIEPTHSVTNMAEALELTEAYMTMPIEAGVNSTPITGEQESKVVLYSDGAIADAADIFLRHNTIEYISIGDTSDNVAITALTARRNYERPELVDTLLRIENFGPSEIKTDLSIYVDGRLRMVESITLSAGYDAALGDPTTRPSAPRARNSARSLSFSLTLEEAGLLEARLSRRDALRLDDRAYAVIPPPDRLRVLLVSKKNFFLESVFAGLPLEEVIYKTPEQYEALPDDELEKDGRSLYDVVVLDKHNTSRLPVGNYFFFGSVPLIEQIQTAGEVEGQELMWWDETHAILRNVELAYVHVASWLELDVPKSAQRLIEGPQGPVLLRYSKDARQYLILAFAIENSNWWSHQSFPVFMYNAIRFLGSESAGAETSSVRPGETLRVSLPIGSTEAKFVRPDDSTAIAAVDSGGVARYGGTDMVGVYRVENGIPGRDKFAVNLEDDWESNIAPRRNLRIGAEAVATGKAITTSSPEVWRWFVGAALLIAFIEWYIYNRRVLI